MMEDPTDRPSQIAPIPKGLLDDLNKRFPDRCPDISWTDREVWFKAGQRSVIEFLNSAHERQVESRFDNVLSKGQGRAS